MQQYDRSLTMYANLLKEGSATKQIEVGMYVIDQCDMLP